MSIKAGALEPLQFRVTEADGETPRTGLDQADIDFNAWLDDAAVVVTLSDFAEIGGGLYFVNVSVPTSVGSALRIEPEVIATPTDLFDPGVFEDKITANDIDSVAILAARPPSITLASNVSPQSAFSITVYKGDALTLEIPCYDGNGNLLDLSEWENFRFSIKNTAQTAVGSDLPYNLAVGITGGADGIASIPLPEDCSAYNTHPAGHTDTKHYWSLDANPIAGGTSKTRTLRAGPFVIKSKETPTP